VSRKLPAYTHSTRSNRTSMVAFGRTEVMSFWPDCIWNPSGSRAAAMCCSAIFNPIHHVVSIRPRHHCKHLAFGADLPSEFRDVARALQSPAMTGWGPDSVLATTLASHGLFYAVCSLSI
jgi:hypothetical protein